MPDFVKLAEAYGAKGIKCEDPAKLDAAIAEMLDYDGPVLFDCMVEKHENCLPMIPSGKPHNEMILPDFADDIGAVIDAKGRQLVSLDLKEQEHERTSSAEWIGLFPGSGIADAGAAYVVGAGG
jgi:hypothetical protein